MRQERITFFFISSRMEDNSWDMRAKVIDLFSLQKQMKLGENEIREQFVRKSSHIMEPLIEPYPTKLKHLKCSMWQLNQVVSQRPMFLFKASISRFKHKGGWQIHTKLLNSNSETTKLNYTEFKMYWFLDSTENPPITGY